MLHLDNKLIWGVTEQDMLLIAGYYIKLTNLMENNLLSFSKRDQSDKGSSNNGCCLDFSSVSVSQSIL